MTDMATAAKPTAPAITTKHLAFELAEHLQLSKAPTLAILEDLIEMITAHLKKGERVKLVGLGILQVRNRAARMAAIRLPGNRSRSRPARRWPSVPARNSGRQSDRHPSSAGAAFLLVWLAGR